MEHKSNLNYPAISLGAALERVGLLYDKIGQNSSKRDEIARYIGFNGLHGASATAISAIGKYGLFERAGKAEMKISQLAMQILYPDNDREKAEALCQAALKPDLFKKIYEKWPGHLPSLENLKSFFIRENFNAGLAEEILKIYRDTIESARIFDSFTGDENVNSVNPVFISTQQDFDFPVDKKQFSKSKETENPFFIWFDGRVLSGKMKIRYVKDIDRLIKVLESHKLVFEAIADDEANSDRQESVS